MLAALFLAAPLAAGGTPNLRGVPDYVGFLAISAPTCNTGDYFIWADSTALKFKKCENGTVTDLDTGGAGGGDNISVNGTAAADADFDDATPAAPANAINVKWQKDAGSPNNVSAHVPYASPLTTSGGNLTCTDCVTPTSSHTLTNKVLDAEGTGNTVTVPIKIWIPAAGCNNATAASNWDLPTSLPAVAACRTGTNIQRGTLDFADGASALTAQQTLRLPNDWASSTDIDARVVWISSTTTGDVVWQIAIACASDADSDDPTFTDDLFTADTTKGVANQLNDAGPNTVTTTGTCAAGDILAVRIKRDPANGGDTMAGTARLVGVELTLRRAM